MALKLCAYNLGGYLSVPMNCFDGIVVILSIIEVSFFTSNTLSVFRALRLLRILRLMR